MIAIAQDQMISPYAFKWSLHSISWIWTLHLAYGLDCKGSKHHIGYISCCTRIEPPRIKWTPANVDSIHTIIFIFLLEASFTHLAIFLLMSNFIAQVTLIYLYFLLINLRNFSNVFSFLELLALILISFPYFRGIRLTEFTPVIITLFNPEQAC